MQDRIALGHRDRLGGRNRRRFDERGCVSVQIEMVGEESAGENGQPDEEDEKMQPRPVLPAEPGGGMLREVSRLQAASGPRSTRAERAFDAPRLLLEAERTRLAPPSRGPAVLSGSAERP